MYFKRQIDAVLQEWVKVRAHKPLLLRGARQVGKSSTIDHLGKSFKHYICINFERNPEFKTVFQHNLDVKRITAQISAMTGIPVVPQETLIFFDEIQNCLEAIMSLRFFYEEFPQLHVIAAGSLLEFALREIPTYGVGRIHSLMMRPMSFDEFAEACGHSSLLEIRNSASPSNPLPPHIHNKFIDIFRTYMMVGGMPESVVKWISTGDYLQCQSVQDDIIVTYEDDFSKYKKKVNPQLLRATFRSAALQITQKFTYSKVGGGYKAEKVREALELLSLAGLIIQAVHSDCNGLPLGSEADLGIRKVLILDPGIQLRLMNMSLGNNTEITKQILTTTAADLVNKGALAEMIAGLELLQNKPPHQRHELFYWVRKQKNSESEVDYVEPHHGIQVPIEVKAGTQGGMKSLWIMMREKKLIQGFRCSLENFGKIQYKDYEDNETIRNVSIVPLYSISQINNFNFDNEHENF